MDCEICTEPFDAARRRPKFLPCGHSACLACLEAIQGRRCPECRRVFACAARDLLDDVALMRLPRQWCSDCKSTATSDCLDSHTLKSTKAALKDEVSQLQVRAAQLAVNLQEALRVDDDDAGEQALRVLELARQPGTTLEVSVRGQSGEALPATWTSPPAGQQCAVEAVEAVSAKVLVPALAKKGLWQQRGEQGRGEAAGRDGAQEGQDEGQGGAAPDLPVLEDLRLECRLTPQRKEELLRTVREHRVRRMTRVLCDEDYAWSLQLLQLAAPHVEELQVGFDRREHLEAVLAMPRLRRLAVRCLDQSLFPVELPPLPAHHVGLRWLGVHCLPRETTFSLIRRHAATLEELWLCVGMEGGRGWPWGCDDLDAALGRCGLAGLKTLVLWRPVMLSLVHDPQRCPAELSAVRGALPGVTVECSKCDGRLMAF